jgi:hypothetical protein
MFFDEMGRHFRVCMPWLGRAMCINKQLYAVVYTIYLAHQPYLTAGTFPQTKLWSSDCGWSTGRESKLINKVGNRDWN